MGFKKTKAHRKEYSDHLKHRLEKGDFDKCADCKKAAKEYVDKIKEEDKKP